VKAIETPLYHTCFKRPDDASNTES